MSYAAANFLLPISVLSQWADLGNEHVAENAGAFSKIFFNHFLFSYIQVESSSDFKMIN